MAKSCLLFIDGAAAMKGKSMTISVGISAAVERRRADNLKRIATANCERSLVVSLVHPALEEIQDV
jgi:hypothetical protein